MSASPTEASEKRLAAVKAAVSCSDAVNALFFCASPGHQADRWYKQGELDGCGRHATELQLCLRLKLAGPQQARDIVARILKGSSGGAPPTLGGVWEARGAPGRGAAGAEQRQ